MFSFSLILLLLLCCYYLIKLLWPVKKSCSLPINWPVMGMLPSLLHNAYRIHEFATDILQETTQGTFVLEGPWFCNLDIVVTSDPANIHHILSKNFSNYPKGTEFRKIFDILGNGIFNSDDELWEIQRKITLSLMNHQNFYKLLERTTWEKIEQGLIPVLDHFVDFQSFDLQDIFQRFTFDGICKLLLDHDPLSLSINLPYVPCEKAFNSTMEALLYRHILPETIWRFQKWFGIGKEKNLSKAWVDFDHFIYSVLENLTNTETSSSKEGVNFDFDCLKTFSEAYESSSSSSGKLKSHVFSGDLKVFLRDTILNLMLAGRDTTSTGLTWLFWLLSKNPSVEIKVRKEIESVLNIKDDDDGRNLKFFSVQDSRKLVYLHGAISEALRLFPPVAFESKSPIKPDILPSGLKLDANAKVILSFYSMGRMESIWGKDCLEFKPERWISSSGNVKHEPSFKFPAFNAGRRTCLGKEMAYIQMKMVAATIISKYKIKAVEGHPIAPIASTILQMKGGFPVNISRRNFIV